MIRKQLVNQEPQTTAVLPCGEQDEDSLIRTLTASLHHLRLHQACDSIVDEMVALEADLERMRLSALKARDVLQAPSEFYLQPRWKREACSGDQMLQALFDCLSRFDQGKFRRSREQVEMHLMWTQACLPQIYAHEYPSKLPELLRRFGVSSFWAYVAIFATRRFGKTFAMGASSTPPPGRWC